MDNNQYSRMCINILSNRDWYWPVGSDIVEAFSKKFYALVDEAFQNRVISKQTFEFIRTPYPRVATFYSLPKIHRNAIEPPGRPIISGNGAIAENLSRLVDKQIKPFILTIPSYVRDTIHLLQKLWRCTRSQRVHSWKYRCRSPLQFDPALQGHCLYPKGAFSN